MMEMMRWCWQWMMSLGWIGMALGLALLAGFVVLTWLLIARLVRDGNQFFSKRRPGQ